MEIYKKIVDLKMKNQSFVVATVVQTEGSAPGKVGFKIIIESDGSITGTVGGGALEKHVIEEAINRMRYGGSGIQEYILSDKSTKIEGSAKVIPMMCAGKMMIYYGVHGQLPAVYIFGGGHVGHSLIHHLYPLGYHIVLIDNRQEYANEIENPFASEIEFMDYIEYTERFKPVEDAFAVLLTHGHKFDYGILKTLYERKLKLKYIGAIASKSKAQSMKTKLKEELGEELDISNLSSPVGLKIGGDSPHEIALSISAEIQSVRYGKKV